MGSLLPFNVVLHLFQKPFIDDGIGASFNEEGPLKMPHSMLLLLYFLPGEGRTV